MTYQLMTLLGHPLPRFRLQPFPDVEKLVVEVLHCGCGLCRIAHGCVQRTKIAG